MFGLGLLEIAFAVLVVLGGPIALTLLFVAGFKGKILVTSSETDEASAKEILDGRYASGEISREEYQTIQDDIMRKQNA